jgi:glucan phosphoethanolaminetransferase (alkaline phosphatase superfamily)
MKARQITLMITIIYCILGNFVGYLIATGTVSDDGLLCYLFIPYTFIWSITSLVGFFRFDWLTIMFEILAFLLSLACFFPIGLYFDKSSRKFLKNKTT